MIQRLVMLLFILLTSKLWAHQKQVGFSVDSGTVTFSFKTKRMPSICPMRVTSFGLVRPSRNGNGLVEASFEIPPKALCAKAFGHSEGTLTIEIGSEFPQIVPGTYSVKLNGQLAEDVLVVPDLGLSNEN